MNTQPDPSPPKPGFKTSEFYVVSAVIATLTTLITGASSDAVKIAGMFCLTLLAAVYFLSRLALKSRIPKLPTPPED